MKLENMTWPQAEKYFKNNDMVIIPLGSLECHGRHMPLGTDTIIPMRIAELLEERTDAVIAPSVNYGCTDYLASFPGTVSLGHDVLYQLLSAIVNGLYSHGARKFVVINGHGGNIPVLDRVSLDLFQKGALLAQLNWWQLVWKLTPDEKGQMPWVSGHGDAQETSAILAIDPELVDQNEISDSPMNSLSETLTASGMRTVQFQNADIPVSRLSRDVSDNGWFGPKHPADADAEWGKRLIEVSVDYIADFIEAFKKAALTGEYHAENIRR